MDCLELGSLSLYLRLYYIFICIFKRSIYNLISLITTLKWSLYFKETLMTSTTLVCSITTNFRWRVWQVEIVVNNIANLVRNRDRRVVRVERDVEVLHVKLFFVHLGFRNLVLIFVLRRLFILVLFSLGFLLVLMVLNKFKSNSYKNASRRWLASLIILTSCFCSSSTLRFSVRVASSFSAYSRSYLRVSTLSRRVRTSSIRSSRA